MKRVLIGLFIVLGLFLLMPTTVQAADYNLWVSGVQVTDENKDGVTGEGIEGTVTYDPDNKILTLDNARITGVYTDTATYYVGNTYGIYFHSINLTINLVGNNSIEIPVNPVSSASSSGINQKALDASDLTIQGDGNLTVSVGPARYVYCINSSRGTTTIGGEASLTLQAGSAARTSYGIFHESARAGAPYAITIWEQAQVTIEAAGGAGGGYAIGSNSAILITGDAVVNATVLGTTIDNTVHTSGISSSNGMLVISDQAVVTAAGGATSGEYSYSYGIRGSSVEVLDSAQVSASGGYVDGTGSNSYGVFGHSSVTISNTAQVTATGGTAVDPGGASYGIGCSDGDSRKIQITGGIIEAQGNTRAYYKQPVDGSGTPLDIPGWDGTAPVTYPPAPVYSISLDQNETYTFPTSNPGYEALTALSVTVTNDGNQPTGELTVALSGANADSFNLSKTTIPSLAVSGTDSFSLAPVSGLAAGTYTATVTVSGSNGISESFSVSFTVTAAPGGSNGGGSDGGSSGSYIPAIISSTDSSTGITAEGNLSGTLEVKPLVESGSGTANEVIDPATYNELKITVDDGYTVVSAYEVDLTSFSGDLTLSFPVAAEHNGKGFLVVHKTKSGRIINYTGTVENGKITIKVTELSPFMIAILEPQVTPGTKTSNPFTDVKESDWFYNTVLQNLEKGLLKGTSATTFSPNAPMTRGMFAAVLARIDGADLSGYTTTSFRDVVMSKYYVPSVAWAAEKGIISGYGNGLFGAEDGITREQMAAMLANFIRVRDIEIPVVKGEAAKYADDSKISSWAKDSVYKMQVQGLIGGRPGKLYDPKSIATRAEVAQVLLNYANGVK